MIKEKINSQKGITIVAVVTSVVILLILSSVTIYSVRISNNAGPYNKMVADITLLEDKILVYYNKYGDIPIHETSATVEIDEVDYYRIDLSKLENVTLNFGKRNR